jgi:nitroreductase
LETGDALGQLQLTNEELLTTTRTVRRRLDLERPVDPDVVRKCLRIAFQAPTGANAQNWGWVVITDPELRRRAGEIYRVGGNKHRELFPEAPLNLSGYQMAAADTDFSQVLASVPVLVVPAFSPRFGTESVYAQASLWGSLLPAVWNFMLALRMHGLGSAWTTTSLHCHEEMADLLGIPSGYFQAGLFPVAHTIGTDFKPADRSYSENRIFWNRWGDHDGEEERP